MNTLLCQQCSKPQFGLCFMNVWLFHTIPCILEIIAVHYWENPINQSVLKDERGVLNTACASKRGHLETCWWVKWWSTSGWYGAHYFKRNPNGSKGHGYGSSSNVWKIHATNIVVDLKLFCILFGDFYVMCVGLKDPMIPTSCSQTVRPSIFRRIGSKRIDSKK